MPRPSILNSGAFRLALLYAALFAAGAVVLFAAVNVAVKQYTQSTTANAVRDEMALLRSEALLHGAPALGQLIARRERAMKAREFLYLLRDPQGRRIAGELPASVAHPGWGEVGVPEPPDPLEPSDEQALVRTFGARLPDGSLLVVGRNTYDLEELAEWLNRVTIWSGVGVTLLALIGGFLIAAVFLQRLERVNGSLQRIMVGRLSERVPSIGMGQEYDRLTANLNRMLDRMEGLMAGLKQVSTDIAHDLRTPLTRLRQRLESARGLPSSEAVDGAIEGALVQMDDVLAIFNALLRIGQIEGGAGRSRFEAVNLSEVLERVRSAYQPSAEDRGQTLSSEIEPDVYVRGDAELLAQLFANLLENAMTHAGSSARINLSLVGDDSGVRASIADDGPGVPAAERDRVLRRFYRLDASRTSPGSGLGLALVSAIAELHEAQLALGDNQPGLVVTIRFGKAGSSTTLPPASLAELERGH